MKFCTALLLFICSAMDLTDGAGPRGATPAVVSTERHRQLKKSAPKTRKCRTKQEEGQVDFECKAETEGDGTEIEDEIDFSIRQRAGRGIAVKVKYEQEIKFAEVDGAEDNEAENDTENEAENEGEADTESGADNEGENEEQNEGEISTAEEGSERKLQTVTETETETEFEVTFDRIFEYANVDGGTEAYDWDLDEIVQEISLANMGAFSDVTTDGDISTFNIDVDGMATFQFTISQSTVEGMAATANKMKIDIRLANFPWQRDDTYIALVCSVESKREVEVEYADGTDEKAEDVLISFDESSASGYIPFGEYTWATQAEVVPGNMTNATNTTEMESEVIEVLATSTSSDDPNTQVIAFSFVGKAAMTASDIFWDPEAGINYVASSASIHSFALVASLLSVSMLMLW